MCTHTCTVAPHLFFLDALALNLKEHESQPDKTQSNRTRQFTVHTTELVGIQL
jgi:hypothetical protein